LLYNRNLRESEAIELFLHGHYEDNFDPFLFNKMAEAIDLTIEHIKRGDKICVYGDYDADGMTASALLYEVLTTLRADCFVYIPDRSSEGYGLHREAIDKAIKHGAKLLITVDGGIRNNKEIAYAQERGLKIIITDHHTPPENIADLPACLIINAHLKSEKYPVKFLAGDGVEVDAQVLDDPQVVVGIFQLCPQIGFDEALDDADHHCRDMLGVARFPVLDGRLECGWRASFQRLAERNLVLGAERLG